MTRAEEAKHILLTNNRGGHTIPSPLLYPFQWLWDSGFIALGYAQFDEQKAWAEIDALFKGQWANGLLPHIIFHEESDAYFPGPDIWKAHETNLAVSNPKTSGIIQPPVLGFVVEQLYDLAEDKEQAKNMILRWLPKIKAFHQYLYRERDPNKEHLVYIRHNWESGLDNSPLWDEALNRIQVPHRDLEGIRRDLAHVKADNRPSNDEYLKYIWLVDLFAEHEYVEAEIQKVCPFLIQDPVLNALLIASNFALHRLSNKLSVPDPDFLHWATKGKEAMNTKLWNPKNAHYAACDLTSNALTSTSSNAGFMAALFAGVPSQSQAETIVQKHLDSFPSDEFHFMPTVMPNDSLFDGKRYWRGPVWINTNWLLIRGLQRYGFHSWAQKVRVSTLRLLEEFGFYEYFHPSKATPEACGTPQFSWSAALYLDLLHRE